MNDKPNFTAHHYEIRLNGHLDARWGNLFEGLTITLEENGTTLLSGPVADQAALHGLLRIVRDFGFSLVAVNRVQFVETHPYHKKGEMMNTSAIPTKKIDTKVLLSTLWAVVMFNMLKADILSLYIPGSAEELARTSASVGAPIPQLMLFGGIMGELAIVMIILSRVLKYGINRWVNIFIGLVTIAYIWVGGPSYPHYLFLATVETLCLLLIIWFAWIWRNAEA